MIKIAVVATNHKKLGDTGFNTGAHLLELCHVVFHLERANFTVDLCSPCGGEIPIDPNSVDLSEPILRDYYERKSFLYRLQHSLPLGTMKYSAIIFCGGWGALWDFPNNPLIATFLAANSGVPIGALSQGVGALLTTAFPQPSWFKLAGPTLEEDRDVGLDKLAPISLQQKLSDFGYTFISRAAWTN
ncbi:MAG: hypothetical protein H6623_09100, partial [Bdellovibrionaceae bacterium]|nr:hypothetical protein [Pseudobdellovibrionaceae bacterium]